MLIIFVLCYIWKWEDHWGKSRARENLVRGSFWVTSDQGNCTKNGSNDFKKILYLTVSWHEEIIGLDRMFEKIQLVNYFGVTVGHASFM